MPDAISLAPDQQQALADWCVECAHDPLRFVLEGYGWGEPGPLERFTGPYSWQRDFLEDVGRQTRARAFDGLTPVSPLQFATSSGHGIGKSTLVAWLVDWIMSTRGLAHGTITANTSDQLQFKTWAAIKTWTERCITAPWFEINSARMYHRDYPSDWFCSPITCREENSEAFQGQHAATSTSFYFFDEASAVPDKIYEAAAGGLVRGEPMWFLFGNPTRREGAFYRACFGADRHRWTVRTIDARTCEFAEHNELHQQWVEDYGEDSDWVRVRVRGLPPRASDAQFIDQERITQAQKRQVVVLPDEPLVAGADLAWGGSDDNVIRFRRGLDGRSLAPIRIKGEFTRDPSVLTTRLADVLSTEFAGARVHTLFLDSAGIAGPIAARLRQMGYRNVIEVNFGAHSPDEKCRFMRDHMWQKMKDWLLTGAIDSDPQLETDLGGPGVRPDSQQRVWLEDKEHMKKRGLDSPDDADALALTFAMPIGPARKPTVKPQPMQLHERDLSWLGS